jgi:hypothetical protein
LDAKIKMRKRSRKFDGNVAEITLVYFSLKVIIFKSQFTKLSPTSKIMQKITKS